MRERYQDKDGKTPTAVAQALIEEVRKLNPALGGWFQPSNRRRRVTYEPKLCPCPNATNATNATNVTNTIWNTPSPLPRTNGKALVVYTPSLDPDSRVLVPSPGALAIPSSDSDYDFALFVLAVSILMLVGIFYIFLKRTKHIAWWYRIFNPKKHRGHTAIPLYTDDISPTYVDYAESKNLHQKEVELIQVGSPLTEAEMEFAIDK